MQSILHCFHWFHISPNGVLLLSPSISPNSVVLPSSPSRAAGAHCPENSFPLQLRCVHTVHRLSLAHLAVRSADVKHRGAATPLYMLNALLW